MKFVIVCIALIFLFIPHSFAAEMSEVDTGTYEWLNFNGKPTGVLDKLSRSNDGKWTSEVFLPGQGWANVSCDVGCEYRNSSLDEINKILPSSWIENFDITCIQNIAKAFCRFSGKTESNLNGHLIVALVTGKPITLMVHRVDQP